MSAPRASHASRDLAVRRHKAAKVRRLLEGVMDLEGRRLLEVGTGSGAIAEALAQAAGPSGTVEAVDVVDERVVVDRVQFTTVTGTTVPFADGSFDVVVSNHVIEHVGDRSDQLAHVQELARLLRPGGWAYLALPNRWAPVEPHFRLPLLSWLPRPLRSPYVRLAGRGERYDCDPISRREARRLVEAAGLELHDRTMEAMRLMRQLESPSPLARLVLSAPAPVVALGRPLVPTEVALLRKPAEPT
jgi:SAM-dependent methyltransferase